MSTKVIWIVGFICFILALPLTGYAKDELAVCHLHIWIYG